MKGRARAYSDLQNAESNQTSRQFDKVTNSEWRMKFRKLQDGLMFYRLVGTEHRDLTASEFIDFLHTTLGISKPESLVGLHRAATHIAHRPRRLGWNRTVSDFEFILFLSYLLRGSLAERAELVFYALDQDGDGVLRRSVELTNFLKGSFDLSITVANPELEGNIPIRDTIDYISKIILDGRPEGIQLPEFINLVEEQPWVLESLLPCLPEELQNISFQTLQGPNFQLPLIDTPSPKSLSGKGVNGKFVSWHR
ncbi:hypothetical protein AAHC03_0563 [Spirometra sp. Aus1]